MLTQKICTPQIDFEFGSDNRFILKTFENLKDKQSREGTSLGLKRDFNEMILWSGDTYHLNKF